MAKASSARAKTARRAAAPNPRREAIVTAARGLFLQYGYRRTSMDLLAAAAQVAKPTLYAHFSDKDAVFRAVVEAVMAEIVSGARNAAAERDGGIAERLAGILGAKFGLLHQLLHASPHAAELLDSQGRVGADLVARGDAEVRRILAEAVAVAVADGEIDPARAGLGEGALVEALLRLGHGAAYGRPTVAGQRRYLQELVRLAIVGVGGRAAMKRR